VKRIIRVGSCGTSHPDVKLRDLVIAMGASTDSGVNRTRFAGHDLAAIASFDLLRRAVRVAEQRELPFHVGNIFSADLFYTPDPTVFDLMAKYNVLGVEMETAGIYTIAAEHGVDALAICTVSDNIRTGEKLSSEDRQTTFNEMIELALATTRPD
jgi:purine-nucleoside phosphorylase